MVEMSIELWMLMASAAWCLGLTGPIMVGRLLTPGGIAWGLGNREAPFEGPPWLGRAQRAHVNMVENLAPFAALVLIVHLTGRTGELSAAASMIFVASRVLHGLCYLLGLVPWRTVAHTLSVGAQGALLLSLFV